MGHTSWLAAERKQRFPAGCNLLRSRFYVCQLPHRTCIQLELDTAHMFLYTWAMFWETFGIIVNHLVCKEHSHEPV